VTKLDSDVEDTNGKMGNEIKRLEERMEESKKARTAM
jgi:RNA binding exosome subunit